MRKHTTMKPEPTEVECLTQLVALRQELDAALTREKELIQRLASRDEELEELYRLVKGQLCINCIG